MNPNIVLVEQAQIARLKRILFVWNLSLANVSVFDVFEQHWQLFYCYITNSLAFI